MQSNKFRLNKKMTKNLFSKQIEIANKMDISFTNKTNLEKGKINLYKSSNKKIGKELKKICEGFDLGKDEKSINKKGKMFNKNKSINNLGNNMTNNSLVHLNYKLGNKLYKNLNITDRPLLKKLKTGINLKQLMPIRTNLKNTKNLKPKSNNKNIIIECGNFSNNEKCNISGDVFFKKYRAYIPSLPNSSRKIQNPKKIMVKQFESPHSKANNESSLKHQNIVDTKLSKKINSKKLIDNL